MQKKHNNYQWYIEKIQRIMPLCLMLVSICLLLARAGQAYAAENQQQRMSAYVGIGGTYTITGKLSVYSSTVDSITGQDNIVDYTATPKGQMNYIVTAGFTSIFSPRVRAELEFSARSYYAKSIHDNVEGKDIDVAGPMAAFFSDQLLFNMAYDIIHAGAQNRFTAVYVFGGIGGGIFSPVKSDIPTRLAFMYQGGFGVSRQFNSHLAWDIAHIRYFSSLQQSIDSSEGNSRYRLKGLMLVGTNIRIMF